jgi:hypothetical protein
MRYKLFSSDHQAFIVDIERNSYIPTDPANSDYQQYLTWLAEGNTPEPADIPPPPTYQELRAAAYPDYRDYLDGIVKGDLVQQQAYIDACLAVKELYPKVTI